MSEVPRRLGELDTAQEIVLYCKTGVRSMRTLEFLHGMGFRKLKNLHGGINAYARQVDPSIPTY